MNEASSAMQEPVSQDAAPIRPRDRDAVVQAFRAGVVPRVGLRHVQVGRGRETEAIAKDMARIADGGSSVRFLVADYGAGKTFLLTLAKLIAHEKKLVVVQADLGPDRRLHAAGGQARALCAELMRNMSTRARPEGGALASVVERFVGDCARAAEASRTAAESEIRRRLAVLEEMTGGFDFAAALAGYWRAHEAGEEAGKAAALRWLRAEFSSRTEARQSLGVRTIVDDAGLYDHLKLVAAFVRLAGYAGLLVVLDEMVNLYKLQSAQARAANYETVLRIVNDALQGSASGLGVLFAGTPEFLMDTRRGLYSYEALRSRLAENGFAKAGLLDLSGPVLRLPSLTPEELFVLLQRLRHVQAGGDPAKHLVPDEAIRGFMAHAARRIGDASFRTPRTTAKAFLDLLAVLEQNPTARWTDLVAAASIASDRPPVELPASSAPELPLAAGAPAPPVQVLDQPPVEDSAKDASDGFAEFKL